MTLCFVYTIQVDDALLHLEEIETFISKLESCEYSAAVMKQILDEVQKIVDKLNLRSYTNLSNWVKELDSKVSTETMPSCACNSSYCPLFFFSD